MNNHYFNDSMKQLNLNTNPLNITSNCSNLYPHNNNNNNNNTVDHQYSHEHVHGNELNHSYVDSMFQQISTPYELFYPTIYTNLMTSYDLNKNENSTMNTTTTTTTTTTNMNNSSSSHCNYQYFNNTLHY
ncbi:unnamed protein product [Schistosoma mattheei]|uniref:Uncharacterized protein n=1 Tax=Schistosoma mattheei TaxID=31246 RepID=A0AA85C1S3_9TREM|nr:unnamed protein product [Schistosoma mattheei]